MLPKGSRASSSHVQAVGRGRAVRTAHLLFSYIPQIAGAESRIACSVAKKVAKRAVDRNRLKRQCRAAARAALPLLPRPIIGVVRIMDSNVAWPELLAEVKEVFQKAG